MNVRGMSPIQNPTYITVGDQAVDSGRGAIQLGWYEFASELCEGQEVLDVGCGLAVGLGILTTKAKSASGIDMDPRLKKENVKIMPVSAVESKSIDAVVCIDVIEHVERDLDFVAELVRVARKQVMISTPNWTASRCRWKYHIREYMPHELISIFSEYGNVELYKGTSNGSRVYRVTNPANFKILNKLRVNPITALPTRIFNNLVPDHMRIQSHLFLRLLLSDDAR